MRSPRLSLVTAPVIEPVTLSSVKEYLRITDTSEDDLIKNLITVARSAAENYTRRAFISQTWNMFLDSWPVESNNVWWSGVRQMSVGCLLGAGQIQVPKAPLSSVVSITTFDDADAGTVFASTNYYVSDYAGDFPDYGRVTLRSGSSWPSFGRRADGIQIQFIAGYGATVNSIPQQIKQGIMQEVAYIYENRLSCDSGINCGIARNLLEPFRLIKI